MQTMGVRELHQLDTVACLEHLQQANVARVVVAGRGLSLGIPVNYALDGESIVFRAARRGSRQISSGDTVTFEAGTFDNLYQEGWSVSVMGTIETVSTAEADCVGGSCSPWFETGESQWMRIRPYSVTGRRISATA